MNRLVNIGTPTIRQVVYYAASAAQAGFAAYELHGGDWHLAVSAALGTLITLTAAANASETPED